MRKLIALLTAGLLCFCAGCGTEEEGAEAPAKTEAQIKEETIAELLSEMSEEEKTGQLLMADFRQNEDDTDMTELNEAAAETIKAHALGGVILFAENLDTKEQTKKLTKEMQAQAELPLFIGIDEEGGIVSRLDKSEIPHEVIPPAAELADEAAAEQAGRTIGTELAELGINVDFAPVADVFTNPANEVIGTRAFSTDPKEAAERSSAFTKGLQETGISGTAKHFPGHGDTDTDSHDGAVYVEHTMDRLRETEFVPFKANIEAGVDFIMAGHIRTPNATSDGLPATLSKEMLGVLREELGFQGIIITDAMNMGAITEAYGSGESAVMALEAGADMILMPADLTEAHEALTQAVREGRISEKRLDESVSRILSLKYDRGMLGK